MAGSEKAPDAGPDSPPPAIPHPLFAHEFWAEKRVFSQFEAWCDLVLLAAEDGVIPSFSQRTLSARWGWHRSLFQRFLTRVLAAGMLNRSTNRSTLRSSYTIVNIGTYKAIRSSNRSTRRSTDNKKNSSSSQKIENNLLPPTASNWSKLACDFWLERFGGVAPGGKIGKSLKPLIDQYGQDEVLPLWKRYLFSKDAEFVSPADFAQKYSMWKDGKLVRLRQNGSRAPAPQQFEYHPTESIEEVVWRK